MKIGKVYHSNIVHIINPETRRTNCNMASLDYEAGQEIESNALISSTETVEDLSDVSDLLNVCSHCEAGAK